MVNDPRGIEQGTFGFAMTQADMAGAGLAAGMTAYVQIWYADPGHPDGTGVGHTGALEFPIFP